MCRSRNQDRIDQATQAAVSRLSNTGTPNSVSMLLNVGLSGELRSALESGVWMLELDT